MRKFSILVLGAVSGLCAISFSLETQLLPGHSAEAATVRDPFRPIALFGEIFERVRTKYVDKPDDKKLVEGAIRGMLTSLDPHSNFMDAKGLRDMEGNMQGKYGGVGLEVSMEDGVIKVISPVADAPAARAGVLSGDIISQIDGEPAGGLTLEQVIEKMRGAAKAPVTLTILRKDRKEPLEIKLMREIIHVKNVIFRKEGDVGYVQITQFGEHTTRQLRGAIASLTKDIGEGKLKGFVLDLRNDPGGLVDEAVGVSETFLDKGEIVSTRGRNPEETKRWYARDRDVTKGRRLVVLINGGSASASEIVAGALKDHKRATLLGTRSFGKGSVQRLFPVGSDAAIQLTTARYYTPSGRSIQAKGVEPDLRVLEAVPDELKGRDTTESEASLRGHLPNHEGEDPSASQAYVATDRGKDTQLIAALDQFRANP